MCIVCQTISMGAAALTGILPMATPEHYESPTATPSAAVSAPLTATAPAATVPSIAGTTCKKVGNVRTTTAGRFTCTEAKKKEERLAA